jgi:dTDP-4-dehydrorhamnose 3,5-epimerase
MIDGVETKRLVAYADERGFLMELLRRDDPFFTRFGQAYVSLSYPGVVRAWHFHKQQTDYICAVQGMAKVVAYDPREDSPTHGQVQELFIGEQSPVLVKIPPMVYHGYKAISTEPILIVNFPSEPYNAQEPDEYRLPPDSDQVPYDWDIVMR